MLRFLCIGDMHYSENAPAYRLDDYFLTQQQKLQEIKEYTYKNHVDAILELGDFLDKPKLSSERLADIFQAWDKKVHEGMTSFGMIPVIGVEGNHELVGGQIDAFEKTSLRLLEVSSFIQLASKDNPIIFKDKSGFTVAITGVPYTKDIDDELDKTAYLIDKKAGDIHIHLAHGMLMNKSYGKKFAHTTIHEIAPKTVADITLNGHDHVGYPITEIDGKWFVNPGSVTRMKAEDNEIARMPKFLVIEIHDDLSIHIEEVYFQCAKAGDLVLSKEHLINRQKKKNFWADMRAKVYNASIQQGGLKISEIIDNVSKTQGLPAAVVTQAKEYLMDATQAMEVPYTPAGAYYIESLELENFQSHEHSVFNWDPHLNILAGESNSGKSAVRRALRELYYCDTVQPRDFIKHNASHFQITATLSNGYVVSRKVEQKARGFNGYLVIDPNGNLKEYNTTGLDEIQEILGLKDIHLSDKSRDDIGVNFSGQGETWFHESISGPNKAKMLGVPYGTHYADYAVRNCNSETKRKTAELNLHKKELESCTEKEKQYSGLAQLESSVEKATILLKQLQEKEALLQKLIAMRAELVALKSKISQYEQILKKLSVDMETPYKKLEALHTKCNQLKQLSSDMKQIIVKGKQAREAYTILSKVDIVGLEAKYKDAFNKDAELKALQEKRLRLLQIQRNMQALTQKIRYLEACSQKLSVLQSLETNVNQLKLKLKIKEMLLARQLMLEKEQILKRLNKALTQAEKYHDLLQQQANIEKANKLKIELNTLSEKIAASVKQLQVCEESIKDMKNEYARKLSQSSQCPICHTSINQDSIQKILNEL